MTRMLALTLAAVTAGTLVAADFADARRLGGGRTLGMQRSAPTQPAQPAVPPSVAPSKGAPTGPAADPVMPRQGAAVQPGAAMSKAAPGAAAAAPARSGMSRWLGPVAGLAAGLGLAALASHLGIAEEMLSLLLMVGLALVAFMVIRALLARRTPARQPMQYAGAAAGGTLPRVADMPPVSRASEPVPAPAAAPSPVPAAFDAERFLREAKLQFTRLQDAYDRADRKALADVMTPSMFTEVARDLVKNEHRTEIVALNADLVEVATEGEEHWASVRFRGLLREDGEPMPKPFDEMWNLVKPADGSSGWMLAGIQQVDEATAGHA
ncbi:MAG TPA: TIM44-like domain-containing protein [Casimicrobiaceae bacterium]|nr:TIM44-like domain-containing protein [Casimicrobiaceae bacterium]